MLAREKEGFEEWAHDKKGGLINQAPFKFTRPMQPVGYVIRQPARTPEPPGFPPTPRAGCIPLKPEGWLA